MSDTRGWRPLRRLFAQRKTDVDAELAYHIQMRTEELMAAGRTPDDAHAEALRVFGNVREVRDAVWRMDATHNARVRRAQRWESFWQDVRYGARTLRKSPGFVAAATISIALGIAANTTVFSMVNATLLRTPGGVRADGLVRVYQNHHSPLSFHDIRWFRERASSFMQIVAEEPLPIGIRIGAEPERAQAAVVTEGFFSTLGVRMALGRPCSGEETRAPGSNSVIVLSHRYWLHRMAGDSSVVGRTVHLNGHPFTVVGVAAPEFASSQVGWRADFWMPIGELFTVRGERLDDINWSLYVTGRLARGVDRAQAETRMQTLMHQLATDEPEAHERMDVRLDHVRGLNAELRAPLEIASGLLMLVVMVVLLIACANVANLLLGRGAARRGEVAVRMAIGAGRGRVVRQLLTESVMLALLGGALGYALALAAVSAIQRALPPEIDGALQVGPDAHVLLFTAALALITAVVFGLAPALRASRLSLSDAMRIDGGRSGTGGRTRTGRALVAVQVAGAMLLLSTAALFTRSLRAAAGVDPGFDARGVVDLAVDVSLHPGDDAAHLAFFRQLAERAAALPGVRDAAFAAVVPLAGSNIQSPIELPRDAGNAGEGDARARMPYLNIVSPGYFRTLRLPIVRGREFDASDVRGAPLAAIVNEHAARTLWPGQEPIGQRFHFAGDSAGDYRVVGVARDARYNTPGEDVPLFIYLALAQNPRTQMVLHVRVAGDGETAGVSRALRALVPSLDPMLPPAQVSTMQQDMRVTLLPARGGAALLGAFGSLAMLLAATGIFGVTSYAVAQRTREMGIRAALGASSRELLRLVIGDAMRIVAVGLVIGVALAVPAGLALRGLLYGVTPLHPITLLAMPAALAAVAFFASWLPARRGARVSPLLAMRAE
ncbi:MAG TPA: ABC transporter permease [Gemmatimonadaceae bacterium]|nr:ABC transporter permease [Gemmatimonadaceae bacterium]